MHRHLEAALITRRSFTSWTLELPWVLLGLRSVPLEDFGVSSAKLFYVMLPLVQCIFRQQSMFFTTGWAPAFAHTFELWHVQGCLPFLYILPPHHR